ncbi:MAG: hypothetical protein ABSG45_09620 [Nitrososphaerales archaeon]
MSENKENPAQHTGAAGAALPRSVRIGIPIASILVLLAFALTLSLPANKAALPVQSTVLFVPIYVSTVIAIVFGSLYLFKTFVEKDTSSAGR